MDVRDQPTEASTNYQHVAGILRDEILAGVYDGLKPFPSLTQIEQRFGISRPSAVRCVAKLKEEGLVKALKGAGTFVSKQNRKIGLAVPGSADSEFFVAIMEGLVANCGRYDMELVVGDTFPKHRRRRAQLAVQLAQYFVNRRVAGVIMQPVGFYSDAKRANKIIADTFEKAGIPLVLIDYDIVPPPARSGHDLVSINNYDAGRRIAEHLVSSGARRIACMRRKLSAESVWTRFAGVEAFVRRDGRAEFGVIEGEPDDAIAVEAGLQSLRPDAIVCSNDQAAATLAATLSKLGVSIPRDVMLAGFDDVRVAQTMTPKLTTIHQPCADLAAVAFRTLLERIAKPQLAAREIMLHAPLVVRESTSPSRDFRGSTPQVPKC